MTQPTTQPTVLLDALMMIGRASKQQRKDERLKLGRLQDLVVKPGTLQKYHQHFNRFCDWATVNEFALASAADLDAAASQYVETLSPDGLDVPRLRMC